MNQRDYVRYGTEMLPSILSKVFVSWQGTPSIESYVVNYSTCGLNVVIPAISLLHGRKIPKERDEVGVLLPVDRPWFNGKCIHVSKEADGSICLGIHFNDPDEQEFLQTLLFQSILPSNEAHYFVSYEWEELVGKLCDSDDPKLKRLGHHHLARLKAHQGEMYPV